MMLTASLVVVGMLVGLMMVEMTTLTWLLGEGRVLALAAGAAVGGLSARLIVLGRRVEQLERAGLGAAPERVPGRQREAPAPGVSSTPARPTALESADAPPPETRSEPEPNAEPRRQPDRAARPSSAKAASDSGLSWLKRWFTQGNVPVRIGVVVLFVGVAALLRYATEQGWLSAPIELRLMAVAAAAIAGLVFAWRQRHERRVFALSLQGGAIGILVLTVFAAFRLYDVLPVAAAFGLLAVLTAAAGVLAVTQNALFLAVLALVAGFASPILASTGAGSHVALFSWYALLNFAVFGVAWQKSWPMLNRLGFGFTFVIGTVWGVLSYSPAHYATTQPFLLLFFTLYLLIPMLNELRANPASRSRLDAVLVFGLPLFAFPLQAALLEGDRLVIAFSALAAALIYTGTSTLLLRRWQAPVLGRSHAVLAVGFATLSIPFAFSGPTIVVIWALEGAALVWYGLYQDNRLGRLTGLGLQAVAGMIWLFTLPPAAAVGLPIVNGAYLGGLALAVSLAISAWRLADGAASTRLVNTLALGSLLAWVVAGALEIDARVELARQPDVLLLLAAVTALISALAHRFRAWTVTGLAPAVALAAGILIPFMQAARYEWPLGGWGALAWMLFAVSAWRAQGHLADASATWRGLASLAAHAAVLVMLSVSMVHAAADMAGLGGGWQWLAGGLPVLAVAGWLQTGQGAPLSPGRLPGRQQGWLEGVLLTALIFGLLVSLASAGNAHPLAFVPLVNPLEIGQLAGVLLLVRLLGRRPGATDDLLVLIAALGFAVLTLTVLRGVHHLAAVDWSAAALLGSRVGQAALSVCWAAAGVVCWVAGSRRGSRGVWMSGAVLLGIVLVKLLVVDRTFLSNIAGIVSFLVFGLLAILVGYLAPAPPKESPAGSEPEQAR